MTAQTTIYQPQGSGIIRGSTLILIAFATAFFPRLLNSMGFPAPINFIHFAVVPLACGIVLVQTRIKDKQQIAITKSILGGLGVFFSVTIVSAVVNGAGAINAILDFLLLTEWLLLLLAIMAIPITPAGFQHLRKWILGFGFTNLFLALAEKLLLQIHVLKQHQPLTLEDNVQGVFYISSGGHVVSSNVSVLFCVYFCINAKKAPLWMRIGVAFLTLTQILFADAKQVLLVAILAWVLLILSQVKNIGKTIQYALIASVVLGILWWCIWNIDVFDAYTVWIRPEIYGADGDVTVQKETAFRLIPHYYKSLLNWFFGLGPGHTIGRLGGWMIRDYASLLMPLGATIHPVTQEVWSVWNGSYLDSSMFSPFWGWAGIWGDLGFVGLATYLYLCLIVWVKICPDNCSKFIFLNVVVNGFIFTLMEEPGFMLSIAALIGLQWQERQVKRIQQYETLYAIKRANSLVDVGLN